MAQLVTIRLSRQDAQPWGFRLQGGKDFATPLVVQKVNGGSLAEQAGLIPGDSVIKINSTEVYNLKHKDAQDVIVRSGNNFEVTLQRGGSTWRPTVTPTGPLPKHGNQIVPTVTKTSLAHKPQEVRHSGSGFNSAARPFSAVNGSDGQVKSIVNKQYNTPVGIYSEEAIAETLSAQAEVLAGGVLGVNFKKNEKVYNAANSEVLKFLQEQEGDQPEPAEKSHGSLSYFNQSVQPAYNVQQQAQQQHVPVQHVQHSPSAPSVTRHVSAPLAQPKAPSTGGLPAGQNICSECDRLIVGVFVRIKDKNLHAECFKCSTCGASLKNQGYFNLNNKLYCDIHAKLAALNNPPPGTEGYVPVPIKPTQKLGASTISAVLNAHNLQTNGSTHSPFTSPTSNHDPGLATITPLQVSHSRTSSSSSSVGTTNSCISSLSPNISPSPEKLSPAHSRQSSGSGGGGVVGQGIGPFLSQSLKTTIATAAASTTITTGGNTMNINETTTINHRQNENDMNSSNRNGTNGTGGGYIIPQSNTYNQFLKEYTNKKANDQTTDGGYISSLPDVNTPTNMTSAVNFSNGQYTETSEPIYGTIRADAKIQPNEDFQYITLTGSIIKSVIPPGKGIKTNYKVNQGYSGPKPFSASPSNPPITGPKSPSSYPPPSQAPSWSQPSAPKPATNPYATLPRASAPSAPASQGRFSTYKPSSGPTGFSKEIRESLEQNYEFHKAENHFEDSELVEVNEKPTNNLVWPPPLDNGHQTPTASPLYIPPPETQHVIPKPIRRQEQHHQQRQEIVEEQSVQQSQQIQQTQQWQSRSAPELHASQQVVEIESSSDSYTSTCTTTTTTSEEYQKMYQQQIQAYQMQQQMYEQSGSEMDYHMDMEVASMQQQQDQSYLSSSEFMSFQSGRRSAQECAEYISGPLNTYKLIDLVREVTPSPTPPSTKGPRKVEFADDVETKEEKPNEETETKKEEEPKLKEAPKEEKPKDAPEEDLQTQRKFQPTPEIKIEIPEPKLIPPTKIPNPVPKEWISPMVKALTTAPDKPVSMTDVEPCETPCKSVECSVVCAKTVQKEEEVKEEKQEEIKVETTKAEILKEEPAKGTFIASVMATAPTEPLKFMPDPNDPIPLPEETEPYMPPPMDMKPYVREDFRPKSPLLSALTTAPETPFEPFGHDVAAHFDDLPTPKGKLTMVDALTVAPTRCYTPLNPENALHVEENKEVKQQQYIFQETSQVQATEQRTEKIENHSEIQAAALENLTGQNSVHSFQTKWSSLAVPVNPPNSLASSQRNSFSVPSPQTVQESISSNAQKISTMYSSQQQQQQSMYQSSSVQSSSCQRTCQAQTQQSYLTVQQTSCSKATCQKESHETEQKISFPPPCPISPSPRVKQPILSGLHKPETIPKYQKNWTVLPSQRPVRTPEPQELRENVPLAFVDVPKESSPNLQNPMAVQPASSASSSVGAAASDMTRTSEPKPKTPSVPIIIEERAGPITMAFQSIDDVPEDHSQLHPRPFTPSLINRPAPIVPFYQTPEKLCFEECPARSSQLFDRSVSPTPDRTKSPAPGPPPNPLNAIRAPRLREEDLESPRTVQAGSITTGQSYLGVQQSQQKLQQQHYHQIQQQSNYGAQVTLQQQQQKSHLQQNQQQLQQYEQQLRQTQTQYGNQIAHKQQHGQVLSHYQAVSQAGSKSFVDKPEVVQQQKIGDMTIQKREKESRLAEEQRSQLESKTTTQVGNAQIERHRRVVEEYEHTQTAKTVEIQKTSGDARYFGKGFVANQARRLSGLEQEVSNLAVQSQAISAKAANLGDCTRFPHYKSPEPVSTFPTSIVLPPHDEPQEAKYILSTNTSKQLGPPPGFLQMQKQQASTTSSLSYDASSLSQSSSAAQSFVTSSNQASSASKINTAIPVPAFKPPVPYTSIGAISNLPDKPAQQQPSSINNTYKPTPSTGPAGFKPPPPQPANTDPSVNVSDPTPASAGSGGKGTFGATSAPKRGRGILNKAVAPGGRIPLCGCCNAQVRGPFITALGRIWCPDHFVCVNSNCRRALQDIGFVEEKGELYCEYCFEKYLAPSCSKCNSKIKGDCLNAIGKHYHPECFTCAYCGKLFGNNPFFLEEGEPYCEADWNELFTTKCFACGFPVEAGDRWVEALNHNYHSQCFNCTACKKNLEGQSFFNKGGRPYCKAHAR